MDFGPRNFLLKNDHTERGERRDEPVSQISKHDCEQEWECNHSKQCRINFLVRSNPIRIDDRLEALRELVRTVERRWLAVRTNLLEYRRHTRPSCFLPPLVSIKTRAHAITSRTVARLRACWIIVISRVGTHASATRTFWRGS